MVFNKKFTLKFLSLILLFAFLQGCNSGKSLDDVSWISGKWSMGETETSRFYEEWEIVNDSLLSGENYAIQMGDTIYSEKLSVKVKDNDVFYIANVVAEENDHIVRFKLTQAGKSKLVFENPLHDFPQKIIYRKENDSTLVVKLKGVVMVDEKEKTQEKEVTMKKIKD